MYRILERRNPPDWFLLNSEFAKFAETSTKGSTLPVTTLPNKILNIKITWSHNANHDIIKRINERTKISFQSELDAYVLIFVEKIKENIDIIPESFRNNEAVCCINYEEKGCSFIFTYYKTQNRIHFKTALTYGTNESQKCKTILNI